MMIALSLAAQSPRAQGTWEGCAPVAAGEIKVTNIATRTGDLVEEPMKMAFELMAAPGEDAKGKVHVYFTERKGKLRKYDALQNKTLTLAQFNLTVGATSSDGLLGIALDPAFKTNHQLFLYYTAGSGATATWRVSRFTLDAAHEKLDMGSEKVLLDIPMQIGSQHPGGALAFDAYGDLYITTGDNHLPGGNGYSIHTSANTNDLRAKILRIHPNPDGTYDIPAGNLFPKGTAKTRPEIYIMGNRNPYSITLDPVRRWVTWGEVGPDDKNMDGLPMNQTGSTDMTEEFNLALGPGNYGYPYFAGKNFALKSGIDASAPTIPAGTDWNGAQDGLLTLPAAQPAIKAYRKSCAITGPIYRYDGDLNSSIKFPPHFHRKWLTTDFNAKQANPIWLYTLNSAGTAITAEEQVLKTAILYQPLDMQFGPDGALYVNNYSGYRTASATTGIIRIEYTGSCRPAEPKLETAVGIADGQSGRNGSGWGGPQLSILSGRILSVEISTAGAFKLEIRDMLGRPVGSRTGSGQTRLFLGEIAKPGIYILDVTSPEGRAIRKFVRD